MVKVVLHVDLFAVQIQQRQLIEANLFHETAKFDEQCILG